MQKKRDRPFVSPEPSVEDDKTSTGVKILTSGYIKAQKLRNLIIRKNRNGNTSKLKKEPMAELDAMSFIAPEETPKAQGPRA
jgi:ribosomal protein L4|tara:strand:- start:168 stop:413 length:246 start_codon:yes stop_codon:yes gene_type:complete